MSGVSVLVPWGGSDPTRLQIWKFVRRWYEKEFPNWEICVGSSKGPWCKADAVNRALAEAKNEILVIADADCIAPGLLSAVQALEMDYSWSMPHYAVHRLSRRGTNLVLRGSDPRTFPRTRDYYHRLPYIGFRGGGVTVMTKKVYMSCPLDPRFVGWGQEDQAWSLALSSLHGRPWRPTSTPLWHLWHPPQPKVSQAIGSPKSQHLLETYRKSLVDNTLQDILAVPRQRCQDHL